MDQTGDVRQAAVAGAFYPGSAASLRRAVSDLLAATPATKVEGSVMAAIAPHAGYVFSGGVAATTFKAMAGAAFDTVVIVGHDSHRPGVAFLSPAGAFETPLGRVSVDREMIARMLKFNAGIRESAALHAHDHTVEVQLPFLQAQGKAFKVVPVMFGEPTLNNAKILADAIADATGERKVFVLASTDMSHYPPYGAALKGDRATLDVLATGDPRRLFEHLDRVEASGATPNLQTALCARGGVGAALYFAKARGAEHVQVLRYANSGDVPAGGKDRVVGYCSVLLVKKN